jgi:hypothetical protein
LAVELDAEAWCRRIFEAPKRKLSRSCSVADVERPERKDIEAVIAARVDRCVARAKSSVAAGRLQLSAAASDACAGALDGAAWKDSLATDQPGLLFEPCRSLAVGIAPGAQTETQSCDSSIDCAAGLACDVESAVEASKTGPWELAAQYPSRDSLVARGNMWGEAIGESFGAGGLGLTGIGGGGRGEGIGLGSIGTIGRGAGTGTGQGFGSGHGRLSSRRATPPQVRMGQVTVQGQLPPEVIKRIVRQNYGRFRLCYENGLRNNPNLAGTVNVRFVIARNGTVSNTSGGGSLPDSGVVACVTRAFYGLTFPQPQGGIVTVSHPIAFAPSASSSPPPVRPKLSAGVVSAVPSATPPPATSASAEPIAVPPEPTEPEPAPHKAPDATCKRAPALGHACVDRCAADAVCFMGTCRPMATARKGEACDAARVCAAGLFCNTGSRCEARRSEGAACTAHLQCRGVCSDGKCTAFCGSD